MIIWLYGPIMGLPYRDGGQHVCSSTSIGNDLGHPVTSPLASMSAASLSAHMAISVSDVQEAGFQEQVGKAVCIVAYD